MMVQTTSSERELISQRNKALWRSLKNLGDSALEAEFRDSCFALTHNTHIRRKFIESVNDVHHKLNGETVLLT